MRQANATFLTKLGWRLLVELEALWSRVLRSKYCEGLCDIDMFKPKRDASNAWRGITENFDTLKRGVGFDVENGTGTSFWSHSWATSKPFLSFSTSQPPLDIKSLLVRDMWDCHIGRKVELFAYYFPSEVLQTIDSLELQENPEAIDNCFWNGEASGGFYIK